MIGSLIVVGWGRAVLRLLVAVALGWAVVIGGVAPAAAVGDFFIDLPEGEDWLHEHEGTNYLLPTGRGTHHLFGVAFDLEEDDFPIRVNVEATLLDGTEATLCSVQYTDATVITPRAALVGPFVVEWLCDLTEAPGPIPSATAVWATLHTDGGEQVTDSLNDTVILAPPTFEPGPFPRNDGVVTLAGTKVADMGVEVYRGQLNGVGDPGQEPLCTDLSSRASTWSCDADLAVEGTDPTSLSARLVPVAGVPSPFSVPSDYGWTEARVVEIVEEPDPVPDSEPEPERAQDLEPDVAPIPEPGTNPEPPPAPERAPVAGRSAGAITGAAAPDRAVDELAAPATPSQDTPPSTTTVPAASAQPAPADDASITGGGATPTEYGHSLRTVGDLVDTPVGVLVAAVAVALGFLLLVAIPAELLYATLRSNYGRVFVLPAAWRRRWNGVAGQLQGRVWRLLAAGAMVVGGTTIATFAEPDPSGPRVLLRIFLAMLLAVTLMNVTAVLVGRSYARREQLPSAVRLMPGFLLIAAASVAVSRLAEVQPGVLFGLLAMTAVTVPMNDEQSGKLAGAVCGAFVGAGLTAWLLYSLIAPEAGGFGVELLREALTTITIGGIGSIVVALLPLTFLSGYDMIRWSRAAWAALYTFTLVPFCLVVLPMPESWAEAGGVGIVWGGLFGAFGLVSIATWAWFRFRATPERAPDLAEA